MLFCLPFIRSARFLQADQFVTDFDVLSRTKLQKHVNKKRVQERAGVRHRVSVSSDLPQGGREGRGLASGDVTASLLPLTRQDAGKGSQEHSRHAHSKPPALPSQTLPWRISLATRPSSASVKFATHRQYLGKGMIPPSVRETSA